MSSESGHTQTTKTTNESFRYDAFISYRHVDPDRTWAKWLHTALETYLVPRSVKAAHGVAARARRVFRDEEELSASANLSAEIDDALRQSRFLIVICSPRTPGSLWVNQEVERFREMGRSDQILALLIEGEPRDAFPRALREIRRSVVDSQGLTQEQVEEVEPLAADVRAFGSRGHGHTRGVAKLRLLAKILGLHFDDLVQRDRLRQRRRRMQALVAATLVVALTISAILFATRARALRHSNELARRFDAALNLHDWTPQRVAELDSLLGEWSQISPDDSAVGRGKFNRALASDADGQMHEPYLQPADVERITGELALLNQRDNALAAPLNIALQSRLRAWQAAFELKPPFANLAQSPWQFLERIPGNNRALSMVGNGQELGSRIPVGMNVRVTMTLEKDWEDSLRSTTLRLTSETKDEQDSQHQIVHGYMFTFAVKPEGAPQRPADYGMPAARAKGGFVALEMSRHGGGERSRRFDARTFPSGPVRLTLTREGDKLRFQVNDLPPIEMVESFPAPESESCYLGFGYIGQARLSEFSVYRQLMPSVLNPLEAADAHFARKEFEAALSVYQSAATTEHRTLTRQEAQFKQALCLSRLGRTAEAVALLEPLTAESGDRWPAAAGYELWLLYLQQNNTEAASQLIDVLHARFTSETLGRVTSEEMRAKLVGSYKETGDQFGFLRRATDEHVKHLQDVIRAAEVLGVSAQQVIAVQVALARSHEGREEIDQAVNVLESAINNRSAVGWMAVSAITDYSTLMRQRHQPETALKALERLYGKEVNDDWFYIERAKLYRAMKRPEDAMADLALADRVEVSAKTSKLLAMAHMMRGFIDEEKGDIVAARKEWKAGFAAMRDRIDLPEAPQAGGSPTANPALDLQHAMILFMVAPLAEASDGELQGVLDELFAMMVNMPSVNVMQRSAMHIPAAPIRAFFRDPRGHELAKDFAFSESPPSRQAHAEGALLIEKLVDYDAFASNPTAEQTAIVTSVAERFLSSFRDGRINAPQLLQLILAWKGNSGIFGWKGLSASLDQESRCSLAYVVGMRFRQLNKPEEARDLFRQAINDAANNQAVIRLANLELQATSSATRPATP